MMSKTGERTLPCFGKDDMEDRIQKIIQTVTAGLILGMLCAVMFLMLLRSTGYSPSILFGTGLVVIAFFLPLCLNSLPKKWFYPNGTAWTMSVTLWKASSSVRRGQWSILIHKVQVGYMQNSLAQGRHSVNALVSLAPSPLEDSAHSFHVISFQSDQLQSKLKFGVIFDAAGIRQGFCP